MGYFNQSVQPRIINAPGSRLSRGPPPPVCQNPSLRKQYGNLTKFSSPSRRPPEPEMTNAQRGTRLRSSFTNVFDVSDPKKVDFVNEVTKDILRRGHFTEKAIKRALESQLIASSNRGTTTLTSAEKTELVGQLKKQFGIDKSSNSNSSRVVIQRSLSDSSSFESNTKTNSRIIMTPPKISDEQDEIESFEDDLSSILRDESDADIVELLKTTIRHKTKPDIPEISKDPEHEEISGMSGSLEISGMSGNF